ncbi:MULTISPECIES: 50S ribosomal protein L4 [Methylophaga]|uniref:Large ribosomal subunit protein uL4 n=2 Tax=Methylophaga TaxID=40222 RepID=F5SWV3_9GAMM|nr:50S ribosomal protein L4 [Methylophaga aminisulfidivorans]EGL54788.1 ribosomal protein L4 [Methylophaga aminisulfidivorans MP]GLQ00576.1 50S ribosomal protein L4 [Methylophaga thalassica]HIC46114.1 50S ribosomal protein L4 [Methylophaga sp.]
MDLQLQSFDGKKAGNITVSDALFDREYNESLVHQVVTAYLAGARSGTHAQKSRSDVSGGGRKPFSQKGSGRARAGTIRSPLWRSGGKTFAATNRDYSKKVNRKMYRSALAVILSELRRNDALIVVDKVEVDSPKTKDLLSKTESLGVSNALIVTENAAGNLALASRNLYDIAATDAAHINPVALLRFEKVVMSEDSIRKLEESYA